MQKRITWGGWQRQQQQKNVTHPLPATLHVATFKRTVQRVSVDLLQQGTSTAEEHVLGAPALVTELLQDLGTATPDTIGIVMLSMIISP